MNICCILAWKPPEANGIIEQVGQPSSAHNPQMLHMMRTNRLEFGSQQSSHGIARLSPKVADLKIFGARGFALMEEKRASL